MKRLLMLGPLILASCATPGMNYDDIVGTWSSANQISLRLRSNNRGYVNFADRGAGFVDWTLENSRVILTFTPETLAERSIAQINPTSDEMVFIEPDHEPIWLERVSTDEPPDLDKQLGIVHKTATNQPAQGKSRTPAPARR